MRGGDRLERVVAGRRARREAGEIPDGAGPVSLDHADDAEGVLREGACLVQAEHVDRGERFDRVELLDEGAAAGHPQRRDRIGQTGKQDQPFRNQADHGGNRGRDGRVERRPPLPEGEAEEEPERTGDDDERDQQAVERALER